MINFNKFSRPDTSLWNTYKITVCPEYNVSRPKDTSVFLPRKLNVILSLISPVWLSKVNISVGRLGTDKCVDQCLQQALRQVLKSHLKQVRLLASISRLGKMDIKDKEYLQMIILSSV